MVARRGMHHSGFIHQPQRGIDAQHLAVGLERGQIFFPGGIRAIGRAQQGHLVQPPAQKVIDLPRLCAGYRFQQGIDLGAQHQCRDPEGEHQQHHHGAQNRPAHTFENFFRQLLHICPAFSLAVIKLS